MKKIIIILPLLFTLLSFYSQNTALKVNNLEIGKVYTDAQIQNSLGTPTSIKLPSPDDEVRNVTVYIYNNDAFLFMEGEFISFGLRDTTFAVNGFLKSGDCVSKVNQMGGIITTSESPDIILWAPNDQYKDNYGYLAVHFNTTTQKITYLVGEISAPLL